MLKPHGYIISTSGDRATTIEKDTVQCAHCGRHYSIRPKEDPTDAGSYCGRCNAPICNRCGEEMTRTLTCRPFEQWLEYVERADADRRALDRALGL